MKKLFENVDGNQFRLISENITQDEPKSSLVRKGLKKVFSEGEQEYSYKRFENLGMGYIRNIEEAKKCALKEARELALEFGYTDKEEEQKFVKENETDMSDPEEKREIQIGREILGAIDSMASSGGDITAPTRRIPIEKIRRLAQELIQMHSPGGPVVKPGTGPNALYKRGSVF